MSLSGQQQNNIKKGLQPDEKVPPISINEIPEYDENFSLLPTLHGQSMHNEGKIAACGAAGNVTANNKQKNEREFAVDGIKFCSKPDDIRRFLSYVRIELETLKSFKAKFEDEKNKTTIRPEETQTKDSKNKAICSSTAFIQLQNEVELLKTQVTNLTLRLRHSSFVARNDPNLHIPKTEENIVTRTEVNNVQATEGFEDDNTVEFKQNSCSRKRNRRSLRASNTTGGFVAPLTTIAENTEDEMNRSMPPNSYSLLICCNLKTKAVLLGAVVFVLQVTTAFLLMMNLFDISVGRPKVPPNIDRVVRITQFIAILISVIIQDDIRITMEQMLEGYEREIMGRAFTYATKQKFWIVISLQFFKEILVLLASFLLIINAETIESVLLNFTAVGFISVLDKVAFSLGLSGYFGKKIMLASKTISNTKYEKPNINQTRRTWIGQAVMFFLYNFMLIGWGVLVHHQSSGKYLCKQIQVQFADDLAAFSGIYEMHHDISDYQGHVQYIEKRLSFNVIDDHLQSNNETSITSRSRSSGGKFAFCAKYNAWTFSVDSEDPCKWKAMASVSNQYDILKTTSMPWKFIYGGAAAAAAFQIICFDAAEHATTCPIGEYGFNCESKDPCPMLGVMEITNNIEWPNNFEILRRSPNKNRVGGSVQAYHRPVYFGRFLAEDNIASAIILFAGRRWILSTTHLIMKINNGDDILKERTIDNDLSNQDKIAEFFHSNDFHAESLPPESVLLMSEVAIDTLTSKTPLGLQWFYPRYSDGGSDNDTGGLPLPDLSRKSGIALFCAYCNKNTNPCMHEGECQSNDGTCMCKHGTRGNLCEHPPLGNGVCNDYFNSLGYHYDGGDCCASTCKEEKYCGVTGLVNAFGKKLSVSADGYPYCKDPSMIPITVRIKSELTFVLGFSLSCGDEEITYMKIPDYGLFYDNLEGEEVIYIEDGTECELTITSDVLALLFDPPTTYAIEIYYGNVQTEGNTFNDNVKADYGAGSLLLASAEGVVDDYGIIEKISFTVIKQCLFDKIPGTNPSMLKENTPHGKALRWLNSDTSPRSSCGNGKQGSHSSIGLQQRYVLAVLNFATDDALRKSNNSTWLTNAPECEWYPGISCDAQDNISGIEVYGRDLSGKLPSEIGLLQRLEKFDLSYNRIAGTIPTEIGNLRNLHRLQVMKNFIDGKIPTEVGYLVNLEVLYLAMNRFTGTIPSEIGNLAKLEQFIVAVNKITGEIPIDFFNLVNLEDIAISSNQLEGILPTLIRNLTKLKTLAATENSFTGAIPSEIGYLTSMEVLLLNRNELAGSIPSQLFDLRNLEAIFLSKNSLTSTIPTEMGNISRLKTIHLSENKLVGTIPTELGELVNLNRLDVGDNSLVGQIPSEFGKLSALKSLWLEKNNLFGAIPSELGALTNLRLVYFHNNSIVSVIPDGLCHIDGELLTVDCDNIICPYECNCRGVDDENNYYSCNSWNTHLPLGCDEDKISVSVELVADYFPEEISWEVEANGEKILGGQSKGSWSCIPKDSCATFTINDAGGNGICCHLARGYGSYTLFLDDKMVSYGGRFQDSENVTFGLPPNCSG